MVPPPAGLHHYKLRLMFELVDLPPALPAVVNHHEAKAYAAWRSHRLGLSGDAALRLLTEPEHARLRGGAASAAPPAVDPGAPRAQQPHCYSHHHTSSPENRGFTPQSSPQPSLTPPLAPRSRPFLHRVCTSVCVLQ